MSSPGAVETSISPGLGAYSGGSARTQSAEISAVGLYTVAEGATGRIELGGGIRGWWFDTELRLDPGLLPGRTDWYHPERAMTKCTAAPATMSMLSGMKMM